MNSTMPKARSRQTPTASISNSWRPVDAGTGFNAVATYTLTIETIVPEPTTLAVFSAPLLGLRRRESALVGNVGVLQGRDGRLRVGAGCCLLGGDGGDFRLRG